jgi:excisionase family DNA binding protein
MLDVVYTVAEAAELLKSSTDRVRSLIDRGDLAAKNIGTAKRRILRIPCHCVYAFLNNVELMPEPCFPAEDEEVDLHPVRFMKVRA